MNDDPLYKRVGFVWKYYRKEVLIIGAIISFVLAVIVAYVT